MRMKSIDELEEKKKKLKPQAIPIDDLRERLHEGRIKALQWLISILHYPSWHF